jgi:hypothetical protein
MLESCTFTEGEESGSGGDDLIFKDIHKDHRRLQGGIPGIQAGESARGFDITIGNDKCCH